jgi:SAM-dependent methyltransferase
MERLTRLVRGGLRRIGHAVYRLGLPPTSVPNLEGDRELEWSWVAANLGRGPGTALDFGCGLSGFLSMTAARRGYDVTAFDLRAIRWPHCHPSVRFSQGDMLQPHFNPSSFNLIINCSTIEHVGLSGRYGSVDRPDGDLEAMAALRGLLAPDGMMVMTIPVGQDAVFRPSHRIYGRERLPRLLNGWKIERKEFWTKDGDNRWVPVDETKALNQPGSESYYGLGLYVLRSDSG